MDAQAGDHEQALAEIGSARNRSHWIWYIFPQIDGPGFGPMSRRYSIKSLAEAKAQLEHPLLGPRLAECSEATLDAEGRSANEIFGSPDDMKLRSCETLFADVTPPDSVFARLLDKDFHGERDVRTIPLLERESGPGD